MTELYTVNLNRKFTIFFRSLQDFSGCFVLPLHFPPVCVHTACCFISNSHVVALLHALLGIIITYYTMSANRLENAEILGTFFHEKNSIETLRRTECNVHQICLKYEGLTNYSLPGSNLMIFWELSPLIDPRKYWISTLS